MKTLSRAEAKSAGLKRYFTGKPCKNGHTVERVTSTGHCLCCAADAKRKYRANNSEAIADYSKKYREENKEVIKDQRLRYRANNLEADQQRALRYYHEHRDSQLERMRNYRKDRQHIRTALQAKRKARQRQAIPPWSGEFDSFTWEEAADLVIRRRSATGIDWAADHMIPLAAKVACGLHVAENCQVIPATLNNCKYNKLVLTTPGEWILHLSK